MRHSKALIIWTAITLMTRHLTRKPARARATAGPAIMTFAA